MNQIKYFVFAVCTIIMVSAKAQTTGVTRDFNDNLTTGMTGATAYVIAASNQELGVTATIPATSYITFEYNFSQLDLTNNPYLSVDIKSATAFSMRVDLQDAAGKTTNANAVKLTVRGDNNYHTYRFNFAGKFSQTYPNNSTVDPSTVVKALFYVNPNVPTASSFPFVMDNIQLGTDANMTVSIPDIRINQLGFYIHGPKKAAIINQVAASSFYIVTAANQDTLYTGTLGNSSVWDATNESVRIADFSSFSTPGDYHLLVPGKPLSSLFSIKNNVHHNVSKAGLKAFYYQRASTAITVPYSGVWARAAGHADNHVLVHNSAATTQRPTGTVISCPRGWYDAGDYNKYVVNSGITTYTMMAMYEHFHTYFDTLNTNIPESGNGLPDVLNEALWNLRWLLTMQDPYDGGVYHKLTNQNFDGVVMPSQATNTRYVIMKTTSATLDFSAVTAQAARIFSQYGTQLPGLSDSCINASVKAWNWARKNKTAYYSDAIQASLTSPTINTGSYGDNSSLADEFAWAAAELYTTTKIDSFYTAGNFTQSKNVPGWQNVFMLGCYTLAHHRHGLTPIADTTNAKTKVSDLGTQLKNNVAGSPYAISLTTNNIFWGSNGEIANEIISLLQTFYMTKDSSYLKAAIADLDYLLGRNGVSYSFVTGYGSNSPYDIHHNVSAADGISNPIPGLVPGGPNSSNQSEDCGTAAYPSTLKGSSYIDVYCSYSTNEIAINWNAAFAYAANVIEAIEAGAQYSVISYAPVLPTNLTLGIDNSVSMNKIEMTVFPNPAKDKINIEFSNASNTSLSLSMTDAMGHMLWETNVTETGDVKKVIDLNNISKGIYYLSVKTDYTVSVKKIVVE